MYISIYLSNDQSIPTSSSFIYLIMYLQIHASEAVLLCLEGPLEVVQEDDENIVDLITAEQSISTRIIVDEMQLFIFLSFLLYNNSYIHVYEL